MASDFLGTGWSFPPSFYAEGAEVEMVSAEEDIRQSLQILLSTSLKERTMNSSYGCELNQFLFEEVDQGLINGLTGVVSDALLNHEPRIKVEDILVDDSRIETGMLLISIDYMIRSTNNRYNYVYPFYITEATF